MRVYFVTKRLAFGSAITTWDDALKLRALGVTHIINLRWSRNNAKVRQFEHVWLRFHDDKKPRPRWFYRRALKFYRKAAKDHRSKVFVMCHHGQCRSASLAYFLLRASGKPPHKAVCRVIAARPTARVVPAYRDSCETYLRRLDQSKKTPGHDQELVVLRSLLSAQEAKNKMWRKKSEVV